MPVPAQSVMQRPELLPISVRPAKAGMNSGWKSHRGKSSKPRSLNSRKEGNWESWSLLTKPSKRMVSEPPGRNASEPIWPRKDCSPKAEPSLHGRRQHGASQGLKRRNTSAGLVGTARWQGHAKQLEKPSSSRREIGGAGKPYNRQHREIGGRREGFGWVCSSEEAE